MAAGVVVEVVVWVVVVGVLVEVVVVRWVVCPVLVVPVVVVVRLVWLVVAVELDVVALVCVVLLPRLSVITRVDGYWLSLVKFNVWLPSLIVTPLPEPKVITIRLAVLLKVTVPVSFADRVFANWLTLSTLTAAYTAVFAALIVSLVSLLKV